eukprot:8008494-Pyramimonas_sp.AAC.1
MVHESVSSPVDVMRKVGRSRYDSRLGGQQLAWTVRSRRTSRAHKDGARMPSLSDKDMARRLMSLSRFVILDRMVITDRAECNHTP